MLSYVPVAPPVANVNTLSNVPAVDISNAPSINQNKGTTTNKSRKRKSDNDDLVLPEGSRRIRKKKGRPDENIPVSGKRTQSGRK